MKIGIFGGSFNPIHNGHIHLATAAADGLGLDRVIFMPSNVAPHKIGKSVAPNEDRYNMCKLACEGHKNFEVSRYEIDRDEISYSVYTVKHFREKYPNDELFWIVGSDMFLCFDKWYKFKEILAMCSLCCASRETDDFEQLVKKRAELEKYGKIFLVKSPPVELSSTKIRDLIKKNQNCYCYLNKKVVQYIVERKLYK